MMVGHFRERAAVYDLLARLWAGELDERFYAALTSGELGDAWRVVGGESPSDESLEDLQLDYCRLFIGPQGHMPPVQSVWEEDRFEGTPANSLRQYLDILGVDPAFGETLPVDHVANSLVIFGRLLLQTDRAKNQADIVEMLELGVRLFLAHVCWIRELAKVAEQHARTEFYSGVLAVTQRFLADEFNHFQHALNQQDST